MKNLAYILACFCLSNCVTSYKKTTFPDGTVTEERNQTVDATAFTAGANAVTVIAAGPRVRAEK